MKIHKLIHFIWLGNLRPEHLKYIHLWKKNNPDYDIYLWVDPFSCYVKSKLEHEKFKKNSLIINQNDFFDKNEISFKNLNKYTQKNLNVPFENINTDEYIRLMSGIEIRYISTILNDDKYFKYFKYELMLRNNLASASDILRLLILYRYGGLYFDIDTLPLIDKKSFNISFPDSITDSKIKEIIFSSLCLTYTIDGIPKFPNEILIPSKSKKFIMDSFEIKEENVFLSLPELTTHKNLILFCHDIHNRKNFGNNFIACHSNSRSISIILRQISLRYKYLEQSNIIFSNKKKIDFDDYWSRLHDYRFENFKKNRLNVTSILTGPGIMLEVILGVTLSIRKDVRSIDDAVDIILKKNLGFSEFTMYTEESIK